MGEFGIGKSTLAWELSNQGFGYMSDELAPIDPVTMMVEPYPHALCLKADPDTSIPRPDECLHTLSTIHVPVEIIPSMTRKKPSTLRNIIFLALHRTDGAPQSIRIRPSEAATRLYANGLNQLAHANDGLSVAAQIVRRANCYLVERTSIQATREAVGKILN